jgi:hypothetical protein
MNLTGLSMSSPTAVSQSAPMIVLTLQCRNAAQLLGLYSGGLEARVETI